MHAHFKEVSYVSGLEFDPNVETYLALEKIRACMMFTLKMDNRLIGYSTYFIRGHMHCRSSKQAFMDCIYIVPEQRGSGFGKELIGFADQALKDLGCQVVYNFVNAKIDFGEMLAPMGYELTEKVYSRRL